MKGSLHRAFPSSSCLRGQYRIVNRKLTSSQSSSTPCEPNKHPKADTREGPYGPYEESNCECEKPQEKMGGEGENRFHSSAGRPIHQECSNDRADSGLEASLIQTALLRYPRAYLLYQP